MIKINMTRKYHKFRSQANPLHHEKETPEHIYKVYDLALLVTCVVDIYFNGNVCCFLFNPFKPNSSSAQAILLE